MLQSRSKTVWAAAVLAAALAACVGISRIGRRQSKAIRETAQSSTGTRADPADVRPPEPSREMPPPTPAFPEASLSETARSLYASVLIEDVPHFRQKPDFCGEACAAMWLRKLGQPVDQDYVFDESGLDPLEARGCYTKELAKALQRIGFDIGPVWGEVPVSTAPESLESLWKELHADLSAGIPAIACMRYDERPDASEHFRLVLGYDSASDEVIYHEPAEDGGAYRRMKRSVFFALWPLKYNAQRWTVIVMRLAAGRLSQGRAASTFTNADFAQHMMKLRPKVPGRQFTIVIQPPFVVIGDELPAVVENRSLNTVKWAADRLKAAYFEKDPAEILDIWLFKDKASYEKHVRQIFHQRPTTPFGYYSDTDRALVMNIATGGGTLVHEIVHPFMAANFPGCPAWFNEGLGSLYEQCHDVDGRIEGLTNWRLAGLQEALPKKQVPSFKTLCSTSDGQFYHQDRGTNYSQARYLCYYLEQHRLLRKFYHRFRAERTKDPTGYATLQEVLGRDDMDAFQKQWEAYVLKLTFP